MFVLNGKRINIYAPFEQDGVRYHNLVDPITRIALGITEIADPTPPADYSEDTYYRTEQEDAPYVIYTPKSPEQVAAARWDKIEAIRDARKISGGCKVEVATGDFRWFHNDPYSKIQQTNLSLVARFIQASGGDMSTLLSPTPWKTMDGSKVPLTAELAIKIANAQMLLDGTIHAHAEALKVGAGDITVGWPETYAP